MKHPVRALLLTALLAAGLTGCVKQAAVSTAAPTPQADASAPMETAALPPVATTTPAATSTPAATPTPQPTETPEPTPEPGFRADPDSPVVLAAFETDSAFTARVRSALEEFTGATDRALILHLDTSDLSDSDPGGNTLRQALNGECGVLVAQGTGFDRAVEAQAPGEPNVAFILLDGEVENPAPNTVTVVFDQVQMGYLAGFTAVSEGYTKLGYLTNLENEAAQDYGCGYIQGAQDAAESLGVSVSILYYSLDAGSTPDELGQMAHLLYRSGIQVIFAPGDGLTQAMEDAATVGGGMGMILTESAPEGTSHIVATVEKDPTQTLSRLLTAAYDGTFPGGQRMTLGCAENAIAMDISHLTRMSRYDYEHVHGKLTTGAVVPLSPREAGGPEGLVHNQVTVTFLPRTTAETSQPEESAEPTPTP